MPQERLHTRAGVAAHQHPGAGLLGQLGQRGVEHRDLVGGVVGVGPPGAQHAHHRLSGAARTVVNKGEHGVKPEAPLEVRGRALLLRMRPDQRGIQIDHDLIGARNRPVMGPDLGPRAGPSSTDRGNHRGRVIAQALDQPTDRRVGDHRAEQLRLGPQRRDIGQTVTTQRDRDRQIQHRLARIMHRPSRSPRRQTTRETRRQTTHSRGLQQHRPTR